MEETLGKRIAKNRKRLGMTQDALAEKLGITAQAVSKWENDQSCPDITMLPRLAEIFGITTDELLGHTSEQKVHDGEVVDDEKNGIHIESDNGAKWDFHWNGDRKGGLVFALCILWVGGWTFFARMLGWDTSFWSILWPSLILFTGIAGSMRKFSAFDFGCIVFGAYFFVNNLGVLQLKMPNHLIFPICIVILGFTLLIRALKKPKKPHFRITRHGNSGSNTKVDCKDDNNSFRCDLSFGETTHMVDVPILEYGSASASFGELTIDLSQVEEVSDGCAIEANCSFAEVTFLVPRRFRVELRERSAAFGNVEIQGHPNAETDGTIILDGHASFGEISVRYI